MHRTPAMSRTQTPVRPSDSPQWTQPEHQSQSQYVPPTMHPASSTHHPFQIIREPSVMQFAAHSQAQSHSPSRDETPPPPVYSEDAEYGLEEDQVSEDAEVQPAEDEQMPAETPAFGFCAEEPPLTRIEVYRSLSECYDACGKQVETLAGQVVTNNTMVAQLANRIAVAEDLMTNHVAKVEERVQVLETTVQQELQSPGRVSSALEQLERLKNDLVQMRQLMDEHPLQVALRLQTLEKGMADATTAARHEISELRTSVYNNAVPTLRAEMQGASTDMMQEIERRLKASEERILQGVGNEMVRMKLEVESAFTALATHVASVADKQRQLEHNLSGQMTTLMRQWQSAATNAQQSMIQPAPGTLPRAEATSTSRIRIRSRSAEPQVMTSSTTPTPAALPSVTRTEDLELRMVNALTTALQRMGMPTATAVSPVMQQLPSGPPTAMPTQVLGYQVTPAASIPRVDRSRSRAGRPGAVGTAVISGMSPSTGGGSASAAIHQVQIAPVGATAAPNMMVTMPMQLSAALLGAVPQKFTGDQHDWPEWRRRWLSFVDNLLEAMPNVTDTQILTIFKGVIDDASVEKLEGELFRDADMSYEEFFATMDLEFGGEDHTNLRSKWYNLRVRHSGTLKLKDWRSFSAPFFKLMAMVEDATEEEAERLMLKALPVEWRRKVEMEVSKRNRDGHMVIDGLPPHMDVAMVHQFITAETGHQPKRVTLLSPGKWKIQGADEEHRREIMKLDRQRLDTGTRIAVKLVEDRLTVKDIDVQMRRWLQVDDRVSHVLKGDRGDDRMRRDDRHRYTREVSIEDMETDTDAIAVVTESGKGKPQARSAESHPRKGKDGDKKAERKEPEKSSQTPVASSSNPTPSPPPPGPRGPAPQWSPDAQWWYGEPWSGPAYWAPQWTSWGGKGGHYGGGYNNDNGRQWYARDAGKGDKGGKGAKAGKPGKGGKGEEVNRQALHGGRGKAGEQH